MEELLAKAMQGVDPESPGAFFQVFMNLMALVPWMSMAIWTLVFMAIGALLGWWRGRTVEGVVWAAILGPLGWVVVLAKPRRALPPPLPPAGRGRI